MKKRKIKDNLTKSRYSLPVDRCLINEEVIPGQQVYNTAYNDALDFGKKYVEFYKEYVDELCKSCTTKDP